ncbi:hemagglutinin repeat-containing protein [Pseudomonas sp. NFXW11]
MTSQEDHVQQVARTLVAGGNVALKAGEDLELTASRVTAGNEAYLYAGSRLLVGANNKGHDCSTTYAAVSDGQITVRDEDKQRRDVNFTIYGSTSSATSRTPSLILPK